MPRCEFCQDVCRNVADPCFPHGFETLEDLALHIERSHHVPVMREGETAADALKRFFKCNPLAFPSGNCRCTACSAIRIHRMIELAQWN